MSAVCRVFLGPLWDALMVSAVQAETVVYTGTRGPSCRQIELHAELSQYECRGPAAYRFVVKDAVTVAGIVFGINQSGGALQPLARVKGEGIGPKVERHLFDGRPFAAVHRVFTQEGPVLVVTRLSSSGACHAGYVDGALPNANVIAAKIADASRSGFRCGTNKPQIVGRQIYSSNGED